MAAPQIAGPRSRHDGRNEMPAQGRIPTLELDHSRGNGRCRRDGVVGGALGEARLTTQLSNWDERTDRGLTVARPLSVASQDRQYLRGPLGRLLEGRPVAAVVEQHEVPIGNVVQHRDADLERHHPIVAPVDQQDGRLDSRELARTPL